jgi:signal transduction histidine kinase
MDTVIDNHVNGESESKYRQSASHDLRTPLTSLVGILNLLQLDGNSDEESKKFIALAAALGKKLLSNVDYYAAKIKGNFKVSNEIEKIYLRDYLKEFIEILRFSNSMRGNEIELHINGNVPPYIHTVQTLLDGILNNLLNNAIRFSPMNCHIDVYLRMENDFLQIVVQDYGKGMDAELISKVFERGVTTDKKREGIGLSNVKAYAEELEGGASVISEPGKGAIFTVYIRCDLSK